MRFGWNFSPLEQFDNLTWVAYDQVFESIKPYSFYVLETEYDFIEKSMNGITGVSTVSTLGSSYGAFFVFALFAVVFFVLQNYVLPKSLSEVGVDFSHLFLVGTIHLLTGFIFFFWFADFPMPVLSAENEIVWNIPTQINFALTIDETLISFLLAFFFFGGSEEEEDQDFILEEEEADFVEDVVAPLFIANLGKDVEDNGALFLKVCGIFGFVLINNLMGMLPYSDTGTSSLILTFWVALSIFASLITLMLRKHGINHLFGLFMPSGCPLPLIFLIIPIEFISYSFRVVSLSVRLFANMMAGHTLLKVIVGFSWTMIMLGDFFLIANLFPIAILFILTFLEVAVAIIQAYIFTILTCMYLKDIFVAH